MALYLSEEDIDGLLTVEDALEAVEGSFARLAEGVVENVPRRRLRLDGGALAVMSAADLGLGVAGVKTYAAGRGGASFVLVLFDASTDELLALIEADRIGQYRTGAATGVAAKFLAREGATGVGVIGAGGQAEMQLRAVRAAVPSIERALVYSPTPERRERFAGEHGALVCAAGANRPQARELDNAVLQRAAFVCCDSIEGAKIESGDLIEPVAQGVLDWLEVHELQEVVSGQVQGRQSPDDIVVFKSNGIAAWDLAIGAVAVERARERGIGREL